MKKTSNLNYLSLIFVLMYSCAPKQDANPITTTAIYDSTSYSANISAKKLVTNQFSILVNKIKTARTSTVTVTETDLKSLFNQELKNSSGAFSANIEGFLVEISKASGKTYKYGVDTTGEGGVYGAYLFDEKGLEYEQLADKGLYGGFLYKNAAELLKPEMTSADVDIVLHLYGSNPSFPNTNTTTKTSNPDKFMAGYVARRSDVNNEKSLYNNLEEAFTSLKIATKESSSTKTKQETAIAAIKLNWEKGNAATVINYLYSIISTLEKTSPTETEISGAMHAYSECVGFLLGWYYVPSSNRLIKDSEIQKILDWHRYSLNGKHTVYIAVKDSFTSINNLNKSIKELQTIYSFTDAELVDFKKNWVTLQAR